MENVNPRLDLKGSWRLYFLGFTREDGFIKLYFKTLEV